MSAKHGETIEKVPSCGRPQGPLPYSQGKVVNYMTHIHCINPPGVGVKCPDDEINEQRTLRAPAITLADHRAVYDAKCGRPQRGRRGWPNADGGREV